MYLSEAGKCVELQDCGCYYEGQMYEPGQTVQRNAYTWY